MANEVSKEIPVAKRIVEFNSEDIRKNDSIMTLLPFSEDRWSEMADNALVIVDGYTIYQYVEEYPIVKYQCDDSKTFLGIRLNSFVKNITVSTALYGRKTCFEPENLSSENTDYDTIVYYTDLVGINHAITQNDVCRFLLRKPNLVVSPEGVLVFYTDRQIIATVGCNNNSSYHRIDGNVIDMKSKKIKNIEVCDDFCKVLLIDYEGREDAYRLNFDFDATSCLILNPKASRI